MLDLTNTGSKAAQGNGLLDVGHDCGAPSSVPEIVKLDSVGWVSKLRWHKATACQTSAATVESHISYRRL
jgi:hypothetical protein